MSLLKRLLDYIGDINYVTAQPSGLTHPLVVRGHFADDENGNYQRMFFDELLENGFHRTFWQLIFPGQTAGIVRKIDPPVDGMDEVHVRFYEDGVIAAELEYGRWSLGHWRERREPSVEVLETILEEEMDLSVEDQENVRSLFAVREYEPIVQTETGTGLLKTAVGNGLMKAFFMVQFPLTVYGAAYMFSQGEIYYALEPTFVALFEFPLILAAFSREDMQPVLVEQNDVKN